MKRMAIFFLMGLVAFVAFPSIGNAAILTDTQTTTKYIVIKRYGTLPDVPVQGFTFSEAVAEASTTYQTKLASVHSSADVNEILSGLAAICDPGQAWIGGEATPSGSLTFSWQDGSGWWDGDGWAISEPDLGEDCLLIDSFTGRYSDETCDTTYSCVVANRYSFSTVLPTVAVLLTNNTQPVLSGTYTNEYHDGDNDVTVTIDGIAYNSSDAAFNFTAGFGWTLDLSATAQTLAHGVYDVVITRRNSMEISFSDNTVNEITIDTQPPDGMSYAPDDPFTTGMKRSDDGDIGNNLDTGTGDPRADLGYEFRFVYKAVAPPASVKLILNGYAHEMTLTVGTVASGALYTLPLKLGPMTGHTFHFEIRDGAGSMLTRLPAAAELTGPTIELLWGSTMVGLAKDMTESGQGLLTLLNNSPAKTWVSTGVSTDTNNGSFNDLDNGYAFVLGEGYFVSRTNPTLLDLNAEPETTAPTVPLDLQPGWNMISNPYGGHLLLSSLQVQRDTEPPATWDQACTNNWLTNSIYSYAGDGWGGVYNYESAGGNPDAYLTPWFSYWVYVIRDDSSYKLIFTKPQQ